MESIVYYEDPEHGVVLTRADVVNSGQLEKILATHPSRESDFCVWTEIDGEYLEVYCTCNTRFDMMKSLICNLNPEYWETRERQMIDVAKKVLLDLAPDTSL